VSTMGKKKTIKGGIFDGMTDAEAEAFVEKVLSERPDLFKRIGDDWELTPEVWLYSSEPEGRA
jgi:hypothetical protein